MRTCLRCLLFAAVVSLSVPALAGPPFRTDDPEPVEYGHWEAYLASQGSFDRDGRSLTLPHIEVNYGVYPEVQLHLIAPVEYVKPAGESSHYGYGDTELGVKVRWIQETEGCPQVGLFPLVTVPTGNDDKGLGSGTVREFLPLWAQKSWRPWTTYGGGGYGINPGTDNRNYGFFGWELQRDITGQVAIGAELFHQTRSTRGVESDTGFNFGVIINLSELQHILLSAGRDLSGPNRASFYVAYQLTFGP